MSDELQKVFTISEVASIFSVNEETVRRWIKNGRLRASINSKKEGYKVKEKDLKEFIETQKPKYRKFMPFLGLFVYPMAFVPSIFANLTGLAGSSYDESINFIQKQEKSHEDVLDKNGKGGV